MRFWFFAANKKKTITESETICLSFSRLAKIYVLWLFKQLALF